jgi:hypothetical protein
MSAMKTEAEEITNLLSESLECHPDSPEQKSKDSQLEIRITRLGLAIGEEIERRAGFNFESYTKTRKTLLAKAEETDELVSSHWSELAKVRNETEGMPETERSKVFQQMETNRKNLHAKAWSYRDREVELTKTVTARLSKEASAVLSQFRHLGGDIHLHPDSTGAVKDILTETVGRNFPSEWLHASNRAGELVAISSSQRSHYVPANRSPLYGPNETPALTAVLTGAEEELSRIVAFFQKEGDDTIELVDTPEIADGHKLHIASMALRIPYDPKKHGPEENGRPVFGDWKYGHYVTKDGPSKDKAWYTHAYSGDKNAALATLTIPGSRFENNIERTAYHEFTHRVEDVLPEHLMTRMENAFLNRRTTTKAGVQKDLTYIYPPAGGITEEANITDEVGRDGGFVHRYVGKYYPTSRIKEVMSMGMEMLFAGAYGAFVGIDGHKKDVDHRGFVLGMLATA